MISFLTYQSPSRTKVSICFANRDSRASPYANKNSPTTTCKHGPMGCFYLRTAHCLRGKQKTPVPNRTKVTTSLYHLSASYLATIGCIFAPGNGENRLSLLGTNVLSRWVRNSGVILGTFLIRTGLTPPPAR